MISAATRTLMRSLLKPFFRENGGLILFLLFIMFAAVGHNNGAGLEAYHYSLITGLLTKTDMLLLVVSVWLLYGLRTVSFIMRTRRNPSFSFLSAYARFPKALLYRKMLMLQVIFFLPVLTYAGVILVIALRLHYYSRALGLSAILCGLCFGLAGVYVILFSDPHRLVQRNKSRKTPGRAVGFYGWLLLRYLVTQKKTLFLFVKLFSVIMLRAVLLPLSPEYTDLRMPVLFYCFGPMGHSVLLFQCREMEEKGLAFYRGLPVTLLRRYLGYAFFYAVIFLPETMLLIRMTPAHLSAGNGFLLFGLGYSLLLLMNSILFTGPFTKSDFLKVCCGIYLFIFIAVLTGILSLLAVFIFILSFLLFFRCYYRFEPAAN